MSTPTTPTTTSTTPSSTTDINNTILRAKIQNLASADKNNNTATYYASQGGVEEAQQHDGQFRTDVVEIHDARKLQTKNWCVDREGFKLVPQPSAVTDFGNDGQVTTVFYQEVQDVLLRYVPGATRAVIFDHTRRASTAELRKELTCREPSAIVHNDYTEKSATKRLRDVLPKENAEKRFAIVNLWRSTAGTVRSAPLCFCDSTSIDVARDLISVRRVAKDRIGELQMALHRPEHEWYYFPLLTADEAILFKTFDSSHEVNQFTLHTALEDVGDLSVPRQSIEIRAFVFFD